MATTKYTVFAGTDAVATKSKKATAVDLARSIRKDQAVDVRV